MSISVLNIITEAAQLIGVVFKSETLAADEANDGLISLNDMLDSWSNDNLMTYGTTIESFPMTGAASYTMGAGGNFNTVRPINLNTAVVRFGSVDYPLDIISEEQYQTEVALKSIASNIPQVLTYDSGYPLWTIKTYPLGMAGATLFLQSNKPLSNFAALTTIVDLPPGWKRALRYNLAVELAPQYGVDIPAAVAQIAKMSMGSIKRTTSANSPLALLAPIGYRKQYILGGID